MYASATFMVVEVTGLAFLHAIAEVFLYAALLAWGITFAGMVHRLTQSLRQAGWILGWQRFTRCAWIQK